ncbi:MAG: hypothetical protein ACLPGW_08155 [Roseiarcus sp.]
MGTLSRLLLLAAILTGGAFELGSNTAVQETAQRWLDKFDKRPVRSILIVGNSRTYFHGMPAMVRRMADSAGEPTRYDISTLAWGGASFEENWKDAGVQQALQRRWSQVILQAESRASIDDDKRASFLTYGEKLIGAASNAGSPVALIVNWGYGNANFVNFADGPSAARKRYVAAIETDTRSLASQARAELIDTSDVWEETLAAAPSLPLYEDGNHPTLNGSYLSALMIYGFLSGHGVAEVSYRPFGMEESTAEFLKDEVDRYYGRFPRGSS